MGVWTLDLVGINSPQGDSGISSYHQQLHLQCSGAMLMLLGLVFIQAHSASPSLWVGAMSAGDGLGHCWGRNVEFCVAVGPVARTASILAYCVLA